VTPPAAGPAARRALLYLAGLLFLIAVWTAASALAGAFIIPPPWLTLVEAVALLGRGFTWLQVGITSGRVLAGFLVALAAGTFVGVLSGLRPELEAFFRPAVLFLQGIPPLLWAIPLILLLGIGHLSPILVIALICFPLVATNVAEGMKTLPQTLAEMLGLFAPGLRARLRELVIPHLKPFLAAALRLGIVLGIKASVIAEYFGANDGIGFQIQSAYQTLQLRRLFAWALLLVVLIVAANQLLAQLERVTTRTGERRRPTRRSSAGRRIDDLERELARAPQGGDIRLAGVGFSYPGGAPVLENVSLVVGSREIAVVSGDSGVGKSTLLHLIASLLQPDVGRIRCPERLGLVFQDDRLLPWRSNAWNVALPLVYGGRPPAEALKFACHLLAEAGLQGAEWGLPGELSGGMKKRLAFARCFARFPEAILLDEPFTGLDTEARRLLWRKFSDLLVLRRVPVVVVTHFPEEVPVSDGCRFYRLQRTAGTRAPARLVAEPG
jgi:NitT/TauT family transport system permease protein